MRRIGLIHESKGKSDSVSTVVDYGMAIKGEILYAWVVMPRYGCNIDNLFDRMDCKFSMSTIYDIGVALLKSLEKCHRAGYVYNDLKLDNLMAGYKQHINFNS